MARMYSAKLLDHFENPRNAGEIATPNASAQLENPACGDILKLTLRLDCDRISEAKFLAKGCVAAIACGSAITELLLGKTPSEAGDVTREEIVAAVGGLPATSTHASHLALDTLRAALAKIAV
ncbi:MAG: nitrogen fixation protein NifU [Acidobacteriaceae bacterium]